MLTDTRANTRGHLAQIIAVHCWSLGMVLLKPVSDAWSPILVVATQMSVAAVVLWLIRWAMGDIRDVPAGAWRFFIMGAGAPGIAFILNVLGLARTDVVSMAILWGLLPLITPVLGGLLLRERIPPLLFVGAVIGFVATVALVLQRQEAGQGDLIGNLMVFGAVVISSLTQTLGRYLNARARRPLTGATYQLTAAAILIMVASPWLSGGWTLPPTDGKFLAELTVMILVGTVANYILFNFALSRIPVAWIGLYVALVPASGVVFSALYLGAPVGLPELAAVLAIIFGIGLPRIGEIWRGIRGAEPND
jgi:drug/metabolite transporter (DMT)-like permease